MGKSADELILDLKLLNHALQFRTITKDGICTLLSDACERGDEFQHILLQDGFILRVVNMGLEASEKDPEDEFFYRIFAVLAKDAGDHVIESILSYPRMRGKLIPIHNDLPVFATCGPRDVVDLLVERHKRRPPEAEPSMLPNLQLYLGRCLFVMHLMRQGPHPYPFDLVRYMRRTPLAVCLKELKERPFEGLMYFFLHPSGNVCRLILEHKWFEEKRIALVWLAFAVGFHFQRDKQGKWKDILKGTYPDDEFRDRVWRLHVIVWALAIAKLERFQAVAKAKSWLSPDLWQLVWDSTDEWKGKGPDSKYDDDFDNDAA